MSLYTDNRDGTPLDPRYHFPVLPDPREAPEPTRGSGWLIAAAVVIVIVGMACIGAVS